MGITLWLPKETEANLRASNIAACASSRLLIPIKLLFHCWYNCFFSRLMAYIEIILDANNISFIYSSCVIMTSKFISSYKFLLFIQNSVFTIITEGKINEKKTVDK